MSNVLRLALYVQKLREVTETPGYLARYAADQSSLMYPGDQDCNESAVKTCVPTETGPWAGTWHLADASQDVYYNLASGLYWAWELVPNPAVRAAVEEVVLDVFRTFRSNGWKIMNRHGQVETSGRLSITHKLVWTLIAVHVTGDADARQFLESLMSHDIDHRRAINLADTNTLNKFYDYFANYNRITAYGVILHAASRHVDSSDYRWLVEHFDEDVHKLGLTRMAHRPYFTASGIAFGEIAGQEEHAQLVGDLALVPGPPDTAVQRPAIDLPASDLDPLSRLLHGLGTNYHLVARDAFPIDEQCWHSWLSSWTSPFLVEACGFDHPRRVAPPSFYLNAYWLSRWAGMIDGAD